VPMLQLPLEGYTGEVPEWPLDTASESELSRWERVWRHPAAVLWKQQQLDLIVARYVRNSVLSELPRASPVLKAEVRQQEDRLGLNPYAMMRLRWEVAQDELELKRDDEPRRPATKRLRAVDLEAESG
jgi:hypothetical protein